MLTIAVAAIDVGIITAHNQQARQCGANGAFKRSNCSDELQTVTFPNCHDEFLKAAVTFCRLALQKCYPKALSTLATIVAKFGDCRRIRRQIVAVSGDYDVDCRRFWRLSPNSATVGEFGDKLLPFEIGD